MRAVVKWLVALLLSVTFLSTRFMVGAEDEVNPSTLPPAANKRIIFRRDIAPILSVRCISCHGADKQMGGLRLDSRADALKGGKSGPVIKPGNSAQSKLIWSVAGVGKAVVMPFGDKRLTPEQVGLLRAWIDQGAIWPDSVGCLTPRSLEGN